MKRMGVVLFAALVLAGCGNTRSWTDGEAASLDLSLSGGDFTNNSVMITGARSISADTKYRCDNAVNQCFNLTGSNPTVQMTGLCPSEDIPSGTWTFTYEIYDSANCTGVMLNTGGIDGGADVNNFQCFDSHDLYTRSWPNQTVAETLDRGANANSIACLTTNAVKTFSFSSCAVQSSTASSLVLDCGCTEGTLGCSCGPLSSGLGGTLQDDATGKCVLNPTGGGACSVVCCATGLTACGASCVDVLTDENNCGTCGTVCTALQTCTGGACVG